VLQYIDAIDKLVIAHPIDNIFLCTDEQIILEEVKRKYGDLVVFTDAYRSCDGESIHKGLRNVGRENPHYLMGREVLIDALVLSMCDHLICGHSNVTYAAVLNTNRYKYITLLGNEY
jgi:hypothetical protein